VGCNTPTQRSRIDDEVALWTKQKEHAAEQQHYENARHNQLLHVREKGIEE
jgi:hypothetical protein